nr:DUF3426 domain-containing protein [Stenotrophomonas nitritireducens]
MPRSAAPAAEADAGTAEQEAPPRVAAQDEIQDSVGDDRRMEQDEDTPTHAGSVAPSFLRHASAGSIAARRPPRWQWLLLATLTLLLAVQVVIADRATLAARAGWRPVVSGLCAVLRCTLPAWHQPEAYTMLQREVRPLAGRQGVLQVQASFRNDARWAQAWPALSLSLSDADGRVIGRRLLQPHDYLGAAHDPAQRLEPGQSAQVSFQLREPSAATVAYTFEFR